MKNFGFSNWEKPENSARSTGPTTPMASYSPAYGAQDSHPQTGSPNSETRIRIVREGSVHGIASSIAGSPAADSPPARRPTHIPAPPSSDSNCDVNAADVMFAYMDIPASNACPTSGSGKPAAAAQRAFGSRLADTRKDSAYDHVRHSNCYHHQQRAPGQPLQSSPERKALAAHMYPYKEMAFRVSTAPEFFQKRDAARKEEQLRQRERELTFQPTVFTKKSPTPKQQQQQQQSRERERGYTQKETPSSFHAFTFTPAPMPRTSARNMTSTAPLKGTAPPLRKSVAIAYHHPQSPHRSLQAAAAAVAAAAAAARSSESYKSCTEVVGSPLQSLAPAVHVQKSLHAVGEVQAQAQGSLPSELDYRNPNPISPGVQSKTYFSDDQGDRLEGALSHSHGGFPHYIDNRSPSLHAWYSRSAYQQAGNVPVLTSESITRRVESLRIGTQLTSQRQYFRQVGTNYRDYKDSSDNDCCNDKEISAIRSSVLEEIRSGHARMRRSKPLQALGHVEHTGYPHYVNNAAYIHHTGSSGSKSKSAESTDDALSPLTSPSPRGMSAAAHVRSARSTSAPPSASSVAGSSNINSSRKLCISPHRNRPGGQGRLSVPNQQRWSQSRDTNKHKYATGTISSMLTNDYSAYSFIDDKDVEHGGSSISGAYVNPVVGYVPKEVQLGDVCLFQQLRKYEPVPFSVPAINPSELQAYLLHNASVGTATGTGAGAVAEKDDATQASSHRSASASTSTSDPGDGEGEGDASVRGPGVDGRDTDISRIRNVLHDAFGHPIDVAIVQNSKGFLSPTQSSALREKEREFDLGRSKGPLQSPQRLARDAAESKASPRHSNANIPSSYAKCGYFGYIDKSTEPREEEEEEEEGALPAKLTIGPASSSAVTRRLYYGLQHADNPNSAGSDEQKSRQSSGNDSGNGSGASDEEGTGASKASAPSISPSSASTSGVVDLSDKQRKLFNFCRIAISDHDEQTAREEEQEEEEREEKSGRRPAGQALSSYERVATKLGLVSRYASTLNSPAQGSGGNTDGKAAIGAVSMSWLGPGLAVGGVLPPPPMSTKSVRAVDEYFSLSDGISAGTSRLADYND